MEVSEKPVLIVMIIFISGVISAVENQPSAQVKRVAYYTRWQQTNDLTPNKINATLLTHLIFAFVSSQNGTILLGDNQDPQRFQEVMQLKNANPSLKIMVSLACFSGDTSLSVTSSDAGLRSKFVNSTVSFLKTYGFDGFDIDWEFPAWSGNPGSQPSDKQNFVLLLQELRAAFDQEPTPFLLSAAVAAQWTIILQSYDIPGINRYVDWINLMTYDFHFYTTYDQLTGHNSPLRKSLTDILSLNTESAAQLWVSGGMEKPKMLIGLPAYGYGYTLALSLLHGLNAPAVSGNGSHSYPQNCQFLQSGATRVFDNSIQAPYLYQGKEWRSYDDEESFTYKCNWVKQQQFGGVFTWNLNLDDYNQQCGQQLFPLHTVAYNILSQ